MNLTDFELVYEAHSEITAMEKEALWGAAAGLIGRGLLGVGKTIIKHPGKALIGGFGASDMADAAKKVTQGAGRVSSIGTGIATV